MSSEFTPGASTAIAHQCTVVTLGNNHPVRPSETLGQYGVDTSEQILLIKVRIREDENIGLPHFGRSIDPNALKDLDTTWTIMKLADVIFDNSFDVAVEEFITESPSFPATVDEQARSNALIEFTRKNPGSALAASAAAGLMVGFLMGRMFR